MTGRGGPTRGDTATWARLEPWMGGQLGILESLGLKKKAEAPASGKTIKVGPGDKLKKIAKREYGDEELWTKIYEANKWRIDGDEVVVGQDLFIPDLKK